MLRTLLASLAALAAFFAGPTWAGSIVYNNDFGGVVSGDAFDQLGWSIYDPGDYVANSFSLSSSTSLTGFNILIWGDGGSATTLTGLDWYILSDPSDPSEGLLVADGIHAAPVSSVSFGANGEGYQTYEESFNISTPILTAGTTYWLLLKNATGTAAGGGFAAFWDESDGPSVFYQNYYRFFPGPTVVRCKGLCTGSESFELVGNAVPEPGTLALLSGGFAAIVLLLRLRKAPVVGGSLGNISARVSCSPNPNNGMASKSTRYIPSDVCFKASGLPHSRLRSMESVRSIAFWAHLW